MIEVSKLPLYLPKRTEIFFDPKKKPPYYVEILPENTTVLEVYDELKLKRQYHRYITAKQFKAFRPLQYLRQYRELYDLIPVTEEQVSSIKDTVLDDLSFSKELALQRFKFKGFYSQKARSFVSDFLLERKPDRTNVLLYVVDLRKPFPLKLSNRVIWPWLYNVIKHKSFGFDQVILVLLTDKGPTFINLGFKNKFNPQRIVNVLKKIKPVVANVAALEQELADHFKDPRILQAVKIYLEENPDELKNLGEDTDWRTLEKKAVLFVATGSREKVEDLLKKKDVDRLVDSLKTAIVTYTYRHVKSNEPLTKNIDFATLIKPPDGVYTFRQEDYVNIVKDLRSVAKTFATGQYPLKLKDIKIEHEDTPPNELRESSLLKVTMYFIDDQGKTIKTSFHIPRLQGNQFKLYGKDYTLVNQLALKPITFPKPHVCRIQTSYSTITIEYKLPTKRTSYYSAFIGALRGPLALFLLFELGLKGLMSLFKINYEISETKVQGALNIRCADKFIVVKGDIDRIQSGILYSINKIYWTEDTFSDTPEFWQKILIHNTKNLNAPIVIKHIFTNILDTAAIEVLKKDVLPTDIFKLIHYGCSKIISAENVDDRNDLTKQRLRNSEIISQYVSKQLQTAYSAYVVRRSVGDTNAQLEVNSKKLLSTIIQDPNCQAVERVSPIEELSYLSRLNPTGLGGLPTADAVTVDYRNVHPTYFGNISPHDTPEGGNVGATQHLAIGASIQSRGTFVIADKSDAAKERILSVLEAVVPFVNSNEGARILFATNQMRSSVPLTNPEPPVVRTGYETLLTTYLSDKFVKKAPCTGTVKSISDDEICLECIDGNKVCVDISPAELRSGQALDVYSKFRPVVKVGQKVERDAVIANGAGVVDNTLAFGANLHTVIMSYKGYTHEDAIVVSESAVKRLTSSHIETVDVQLKPNATLVYVTDKKEVKAGDVLISFIPPDLSDIIDNIDEEIDTISGSTVSIRAQGDGFIERIEIYPGSLDVLNRFDQLKPLYAEFKKFYERKYKRPIPKTFTYAGQKIEGVIVKFKIVYYVPLSTGDKLANRHGNKGVVGIVLPDDKMVKTPFGTADIILNPLGIVGRMNIGQVLELYTGLVSHVLSQKALELSRPKFIRLATQVYNAVDPITHRDLLAALKLMTSNEWSDLLVRIREQGYKLPIYIRPFGNVGKKQIMAAMKILNLKSRYFVLIPEFNTTTLNPVPVGWMYIEKLEHMARWKISARSTRTYLSKTLQPPAGKRREGGQRLGELEEWGLLAYDAEKLFWTLWGPMADDHVTKQRLVNEIIEKGYAEWRPPQFLPTRDALISFLLSMHIDVGIDVEEWVKGA